MHSTVTFRGVSFDFPNGRTLFSNLNFSLEPKLTALVGPNGIGKTTLARLLTGELEPSAGSLRRNGPITFFPQRQSPPEAISVAEYLSGAYTRSPLGEKLLSEIVMDSRCCNLSGGEWMRVRLTRALNDEFLVLDEPTNNLDRKGRVALLQFLREREGGALLISHDRESLSLCREVLELSNRGLSKYGGSWRAYEKFKQKERTELERTLTKAKRGREAARAARHEKIEKQDRRNRKGRSDQLKGSLPPILLGARKRRAQATTGKIDFATLAVAQSAVSEAFEVFQRLKIDPVMYANISGKEIPAQKLVAEAIGFNVKYDRWLYAEDLNFVWRGGIRLALKGMNGSGKSTLLKAILGTPLSTRGKLRTGPLATLYLDQGCVTLDDSKSVLENVRDVSNGDEGKIRNGLAKFLFAGDSVFQKAGSLSGGERLRAALARGLLGTEKPELLILDEPTNNLDLANIQFLENLIKEFRGALIVISHDEIFLEQCGITQTVSF